MPRTDVAFDRRVTSHMSAGMSAYVRKLAALLPRVAPDLSIAFVGDGDNFDLAEHVALPAALARLRPRLAHVPTPFAPLVIPVPYVLTIHDLIDLHYPEFAKRRVAPYYRLVVGRAARGARAVITDDAATVDDLERFLAVDPARVRVIPLGVDLPDPLPPPFAHDRPYFLFVGNHRPHKNLLTLVRAWAGLPEALAADLFLTGDDDVGEEFSRHGRAGGTIVFLGQPAEPDLIAYYRGAAAYVHPALREGFGLPMLEAMRAGVPVVAAHGALPRVLAPHAYGFDAGDAEELRALLERALADPPTFRRGAEAARAATGSLTWEHTARATAAVYREFL
ncbi:MAG: glycosyltransferase family 4 protein [Candidatus Velthaea sp.]